jgi:hypothetical protein
MGCIKTTRDNNKLMHCFACGENVYSMPTYNPLKIRYAATDVGNVSS